MNRVLVAIGGLCGAAGVSLSAAAAHIGGGQVATAASMMLMHAPLFVAAGLFGVKRYLLWSVLLLAFGLALFSGDLVWRVYGGSRLFAMAAPIGGVAMIAGWLGLAVSAGLVRRDTPS